MTSSLLYPAPKARDFEIHRVLHDLTESLDTFEAFRADPAVVLTNYDIDEDGQALLIALDFEGLVARGIHPVLVLNVQRAVEWGLKVPAGKAR